MNNGTAYIARRGKDCSQRIRRCVGDFSISSARSTRIDKTALYPANWIGTNQPGNQNVLSAFHHWLGAMHVRGRKNDSLSNLRSKRETQCRKTRLSANETVVEIAEYGEVPITHVQAGISMRHIEPAGHIANQVRVLVSLEIATPCLANHRSNNRSNLEVELLSDR